MVLLVHKALMDLILSTLFTKAQKASMERIREQTRGTEANCFDIRTATTSIWINAPLHFTGFGGEVRATESQALDVSSKFPVYD